MSNQSDIPLLGKNICGAKPNWCAGCGDFAMLTADKNATARLVNEYGFRLENFLGIGDIGCNAKEVENLIELLRGLNRGTYGVHTQHGRSPSVAAGAKYANPNLTVFVFGGDGGLGAIGLAETMHTCRRNHDLTIVFVDNQVYALTKGQASSTGHKGLKTGSTPRGVKDNPVKPVLYAVTAGATFVARAFSQDRKQLEEIMVQAVLHCGTSFIHLISPCVTYQREEGGAGIIRGTEIYDWWKKHFESIPDTWGKTREQLERGHPVDYDITDPLAVAAVEYQAYRDMKWPLGALYHVQGEPTAEENAGVVEIIRTKSGKEKERRVYAPALADISIEANLPYYRKLIEQLR